MARPRLELQALLQDIIGIENKVYFQPPENVRLTYPCIIYKLANIDTIKADNIKYLKHKAYEVTLIHSDPDNDIYETIENLPYSVFDRPFVLDNLYHYVFIIFY